MTYATERAKLMFGCFRKADANDPDTYVAAITAVLADYPPDIIQSVTDPRIGLPSRLDWPPTVKEVKSACESIAGARHRAADRDRQAKQALERRALPPPPKLTREQIEERLGRPLGDRMRPVKLLQGAALVAFRTAHGITAEQWDALPDAKGDRHRGSR
jgi:hypothetical protein